MPNHLPYPSARWLRVLVLAVVLGTGAACSSVPTTGPAHQTPPVDLARFMGRWYVIARVPYVGERGHVEASDTFALDGDGEVAIRYQYRVGFDVPVETVNARASVVEGSGNRLWTTWLFRVVPTRYRILEVAPDYSWALVDHPGRDLAWVLARDRELSNDEYLALEDRIGGHGVNTDKLRRVPQVPAQVGKLGFDDPRRP